VAAVPITAPSARVTLRMRRNFAPSRDGHPSTTMRSPGVRLSAVHPRRRSSVGAFVSTRHVSEVPFASTVSVMRPW
jgi:hypothetical protein